MAVFAASISFLSAGADRRAAAVGIAAAIGGAAGFTVVSMIGHRQSRLAVVVEMPSDSPGEVREQLVGAALTVEGVLREPPPSCRLVRVAGAGNDYVLEFDADGALHADRVLADVGTRVAQVRDLAAKFPGAPGRDVKSIAMTTFDTTPPFDTLPASVKEHMAETAELELWRAGQSVVEEGESSDSCFIVRRGRLSVRLADEGAEVQVASLRDGELFGEMSLLTGEVRAATVRAEVESEVIRIRASALRRALNRSPELVHVLAETVAARRDELQRARAKLDRVRDPRHLSAAIRSFFSSTQ